MDPLERLVEIFEHFPGIGPRQARRFVQFLLVQRPSFRTDLAQAIKELGSRTQQCALCFRWFAKSDSTERRCDICINQTRDSGVLFVVEKDADIRNVEGSGFQGLYFVLGGTIPLATQEPEKQVRLRELISRIDADGAQKKLKEIILGLSATTEGDHTRLILQEKIRPLAEGFNIKVSSLGRGLSTGSELEYADPDTLANALHSRN